ncbi:MAG: WhiB family transcriptional regulator [Acidimicrobiia bacterium]|jgi:WhiB family redox-sensing transcriptional regulator
MMLVDLLEVLQTGGLDMAWQDLANCRGADPDLFFPERGASTRTAKGICRDCQVRAECLEFAIVSSEKFGIWGMMSERERRKIRKERQIAARRREAG